MRLKFPMEYPLVDNYDEAVNWLKDGNKLWYANKDNLPEGDFIDASYLEKLHEDLPITIFYGIHKFPNKEEELELPKRNSALMAMTDFTIKNGEKLIKKAKKGTMFYVYSAVIDGDRILIRAKNVPFQLDMRVFANIDHLIIDNILKKKD